MRLQWQMWDSIISENEVDALVKKLDELPMKEAGVSASGNKDEKIRSSSVSFVSDPQIKANLRVFIEQANRSVFGFDLSTYSEVQYTKYFAEQNGHYGWHEDVLWDSSNMSDRKLSMTVQLSNSEDYKGGDFEFQGVQQPPSSKRNKGTVLVFPSYLVHRVTPVTEGTRKSLVAWFEGPRWR